MPRQEEKLLTRIEKLKKKVHILEMMVFRIRTEVLTIKKKSTRYCDICGTWTIKRYIVCGDFKYPVDKDDFDHNHNQARSIDLGVCA